MRVQASETPAAHLLLTLQGEAWLANFDEVDRGVARELAGSLSLVSLNEFERRLECLVSEQAAAIDGPVALFAIREVDTKIDLFIQTDRVGASQTSIDATPRGADIGSEGRVANLIRNLAKTNNTKYLNHPTLQVMRTQKCSAIFLLDDLFGSGTQCRDYIQAIWENRTIRSWISYRKLKLVALAYAGTEAGIKVVSRHRAKPSVTVVRHCPTLKRLPLERDRIERLEALCYKYAKRAGMWGPSLGFGQIGSLLVFEHGCPDNAPVILWDEPEHGHTWNPLFFNRRVGTDARTVFPSEMARRDPVRALIDAGQLRLARSFSNVVERPLPKEMILAITLISKGLRRPDSIAGATGTTVAECEQLLERCIAAGFVTPKIRITKLGLNEIRGMTGSLMNSVNSVPDLGTDVYHPKALRDHVDG